MLLGLGVCVLVYIASRELNLVTLNWVLSNFLGSVILVIVVLFQDDMRRALTKVGLFPSFSSDSPKSFERPSKEILQAATELSLKRVGALIAITRDIGLEEYTEHAVPVDAEISHQLLESIFMPTSPLHDGAVVVEGGRIKAAGAVLPLSFSPAVSRSYGTRHRAAIGLSERTDAVLVVVSEETGKISLVHEGDLIKDLDDDALYESLLTLMRTRPKTKSSADNKAESEEIVTGSKTIADFDGTRDAEIRSLLEEAAPESVKDESSGVA
ncbi:UNVERIFIED_CONTAM: hypothetical protein GTU68_053281 [Idotea baltica]|nr:hypothetical protein [Idotea baltica]